MEVEYLISIAFLEANNNKLNKFEMMVLKWLLFFQMVPALFGEGTLSTQNVDYGIAFTPDEKTAYVVRHSGEWGGRNNPPSKIYKYVMENHVWNYKGLADFSDNTSEWSDSGVFITPDGKKAYFTSNRPYKGKLGEDDSDIWMMEKSEQGWESPRPVNEVNSSGYEASPVTDRNGNLYFTSIRPEGIGLGDIYISIKKEDGSFTKPKLLPGDVNSEFGEWNLIISPSADWIIFESSGRESGLTSYGDLYLSFLGKDGKWQKPRHLTEINTEGSDLNPRILSSSGSLVFASTKKMSNKGSDFYTIQLSELGIDFYK